MHYLFTKNSNYIKRNIFKNIIFNYPRDGYVLDFTDFPYLLN